MRKAGISAIEHRLRQKENFRAAGEKLASQQLDQVEGTRGGMAGRQ